MSSQAQPEASSSKTRTYRTIQKFKDDEIDRTLLSDLSEKILGKRPFSWQLDAAAALLRGEDLVLDVGTGSGKTLVFALPLLLNETDVIIVVSPLSALMIDQVFLFSDVHTYFNNFILGKVSQAANLCCLYGDNC